MTQDTISSQHDLYRWSIIEGSEHHFTAESACGFWRARVKWDGCIDFQHSTGYPIRSAHREHSDTFHVCDLGAFSHRLVALAKVITQVMPNTDAAENAEKVFYLPCQKL